MSVAGRPLRAVFVDILEDLYDRQGIYPLIAVLRRAGVEVFYVYGRNQQRLLRRVAALRPDLVLYSSFSYTLPGYARFDALLKARHPTTSIIGGAGPTFNPNYIDRTTIDAACIGEGDYALPEFIASGFSGGRNIYRRGERFDGDFHPLADLDGLPLPERDLVYGQDPVRASLPSKQFLSGRGCPYLCTYCFNHSYNRLVHGRGNVIRKKSVEYLFAEIDAVRSRYPLKLVLFNDDTFIVNRPWFFDFCARYPERVGIQYACNVRANLVDEEIVRGLKASNCVAVNWSIESGDATLRNGVLKRNISDEQILATAELLRKYGIRHRIGNLIGIPGETREQMLATVDLNIRVRPVFALANIFVPYPGLDLTRYAIEHGYYREIPEEQLPKSYFTHSALNIPEDLNRWIQKLLYLFPFFVRFPRVYHRRRLRDWMFLLPKAVLRPAYELFYGLMFRRVYRVTSTMGNNLRFSLRYLRSLFG